MKNRGRKRLTIFFFLLVVAALGFGGAHLVGKNKFSEKEISLYWGREEKKVNIEKLSYEPVEGIRINGKGEEIPVSGQGILLKELLEEYGITDYRQVKVSAMDSYSATVTREETEEEGKVYLFFEEESLRLLVFGDKDSKRSVSDIVQIVAE